MRLLHPALDTLSATCFQALAKADARVQVFWFPYSAQNQLPKLNSKDIRSPSPVRTPFLSSPSWQVVAHQLCLWPFWQLCAQQQHYSLPSATTCRWAMLHRAVSQREVRLSLLTFSMIFKARLGKHLKPKMSLPSESILIAWFNSWHSSADNS